jgi:DNA-binding NarL/FixJ family response regulator
MQLTEPNIWGPKAPKTTVALTPRQKQVLRLITDGLTNREIAGRLGISVRTTEVHRFWLMRRLQAKNVAQLIRHAYYTGLLPRSYSRSAEH